jgi:hypothetical protein
LKNQYFGDRHDFYKYDLLLRLMEAGLGLAQLLFAVMRTPDDGSADGSFTAYPAGNRDPALWAWLQDRVGQGERAVTHLADLPAVRDASWQYTAILDEGPVDPAARAGYFDRVRDSLVAATLLFLDPDNGLMVRSATGDGRTKYVDHAEVTLLYAAMDDRSLLVIYQHAPREKRTTLYARLLTELELRCGVHHAFVIAPDTDVAYLVAAKTASRLTEVEHALAPYLVENGFSWPPSATT